MCAATLSATILDITAKERLNFENYLYMVSNFFVTKGPAGEDKDKRPAAEPADYFAKRSLHNFLRKTSNHGRDIAEGDHRVYRPLSTGAFSQNSLPEGQARG